MKKRILLGFAVLTSALFLVSCVDMNYEAYVTVVNIGNMPMTAWVDGDGADIAAYDSQTWAIPLNQKDEVLTVFVEAEPFGGGDSDEITIALHGDRDVQTWLTGWDTVPGNKSLKNQARSFPGRPPKSSNK